MIEFLLGVLFFAAPVQLQQKYDYCKSVNFEAKDNYCSTQKTLSELGHKKDETK